ncbi:MAG: hypothetical protein F7C34_00645 [Desulfurococcales archaeon]|nr:hypothetical protein [Desulfurococcales archaeon]
MIIYAVDISRSARQYIEFQRSFVTQNAERCASDHEGFGLVVYASRAAPVIERTRDPRQLEEALAGAATMRGIPEPVKAVKEALEIIFYQRAGMPAVGDMLVLLWSMPKKPKIPVSYARAMANSVGVSLRVVGLQYGPPKWFRSYRYDPGVEIIYKRRLGESELARKIGCGP